MKIIIILFACSFFGQVYSQNKSIDSIVMSFSNKYRTELIHKDSIFIDSVKSIINKKGCESLSSIYISHQYSNIVVYELTRNLLNTDTSCFQIILNNISYYDEDPNSIRYNDINSFPVAKAVYSENLILQRLAKYLMESSFLNNCEYIQNSKKEMLVHLKNILLSEEMDDEILKSKNNCRYNNIQRITADQNH